MKAAFEITGGEVRSILDSEDSASCQTTTLEIRKEDILLHNQIPGTYVVHLPSFHCPS